MAATLNHSASYAVPPTQNTAPVLEYRCLFTQDLRRKQKRWQDGRLKFHTFNKRVMVYDEHANLIGDAHWRHDYELSDGEELQLERGGYLVQVSEALGKQDQDLSELIDKRKKEKEARISARENRSPRQPQSATPISSGLSQQRPKSLNELLGMPTGRYGRALIPITSPFENRQRAVQEAPCPAERPTKRQKQDEGTKRGYAQNLTGATLSLVSGPTSSLSHSSMPPPQSRYQKVTIDLTNQDPVNHSTFSASLHQGTPTRDYPLTTAQPRDKVTQQLSEKGTQRGSTKPRKDASTSPVGSKGRTASSSETSTADVRLPSSTVTRRGDGRSSLSRVHQREVASQPAARLDTSTHASGLFTDVTTEPLLARRSFTTDSAAGRSGQLSAMGASRKLAPLTMSKQAHADEFDDAPRVSGKLLRSRNRPARRKLLYLDSTPATAPSGRPTASENGTATAPQPSQASTVLAAQESLLQARLRKIQTTPSLEPRILKTLPASPGSIPKSNCAAELCESPSRTKDNADSINCTDLNTRSKKVTQQLQETLKGYQEKLELDTGEDLGQTDDLGQNSVQEVGLTCTGKLGPGSLLAHSNFTETDSGLDGDVQTQKPAVKSNSDTKISTHNDRQSYYDASDAELSSGVPKDTPAQVDAVLSAWSVATGRDDELGPWSREAFDLFTWRPPKIAESVATGG